MRAAPARDLFPGTAPKADACSTGILMAPRTYSVDLDELTREKLLALSDDAATYPETVTTDAVRDLAVFIQSLLGTTGTSQTHNVQAPTIRL